jgi:hypothetical protein
MELVVALAIGVVVLSLGYYAYSLVAHSLHKLDQKRQRQLTLENSIALINLDFYGAEEVVNVNDRLCFINQSNTVSYARNNGMLIRYAQHKNDTFFDVSIRTIPTGLQINVLDFEKIELEYLKSSLTELPPI